MSPTHPNSQPLRTSHSLVAARGAVAETTATLDNLGLGNGDDVDGNRVELRKSTKS